ncbi:hypothetical protein HK104_011209 [Borealophlyctis nickersoniae]|nr:hypothetical protein HK104_011209 [Borealophlyctis nickersoniae]
MHLAIPILTLAVMTISTTPTAAAAAPAAPSTSTSTSAHDTNPVLAPLSGSPSDSYPTRINKTLADIREQKVKEGDTKAVQELDAMAQLDRDKEEIFKGVDFSVHEQPRA